MKNSPLILNYLGHHDDDHAPMVSIRQDGINYDGSTWQTTIVNQGFPIHLSANQGEIEMWIFVDNLNGAYAQIAIVIAFVMEPMSTHHVSCINEDRHIEDSINHFLALPRHWMTSVKEAE